MNILPLSPDNLIQQELGARLKKVRKQLGYTQAQLADASGIGVATLRRIEDGNDSQLSSWIKLLTDLFNIFLTLKMGLLCSTRVRRIRTLLRRARVELFIQLMAAFGPNFTDFRGI